MSTQSDAPLDRIARHLARQVQDEVTRGQRMPRRHVGAFSVGPATNPERGMILRWDGRCELFPKARNAAQVADALEAR